MLAWFKVPDDATEGAANLIVAQLVADMRPSGLRLAGAVQRNTDLGADCACDMDLLVIGEEDRPVRISQSLGNGSDGCRLDTGALEMAAALVEARLDGADLLIVPKFGRQEAIGRGFVSVISRAVADGMPVVLHVPRQQRAAFEAFSGGMAEEIAADDLGAWCRAQAAALHG